MCVGSRSFEDLKLEMVVDGLACVVLDLVEMVVMAVVVSRITSLCNMQDLR